MSTSASSIKTIKEEEDDSFDLNSVPTVPNSSTPSFVFLHSGESNAPINGNTAKWFKIFETSISRSFVQFNLLCPPPSGHTMSTDPKKQTRLLEVSQAEYNHAIKKFIATVADRNLKGQNKPQEGITGQLEIEPGQISTTKPNKTVLTFWAKLVMMTSQGPSHLRCKAECHFPLMGRSYDLATDQGIQVLSVRLQKAGIADTLRERIISDLRSVLLLPGEQRQRVVRFGLSSIQPPTLSDLHLYVKLRPNPSCNITTEGRRRYSYEECHLDAQATYSGATWDSVKKSWKPITAELSWSSGPGMISFPVELSTAKETSFCWNEEMSKCTDLFLPVAGQHS